MVQSNEKQTFPQWKVQKDFQKLHFRERKRLKHKKIYILPIGPFPGFVLEKIACFQSSFFELLGAFVANFYLGFEVELLDEVDLNEIHCRTRIHEGLGTKQVLVEDVLAYLRKTLPKDGYSIVCITWEDLYPGDEWNFILGEASNDGCAALSFGHHEPKGAQKVYSVSKKSHVITEMKSKKVMVDELNSCGVDVSTKRGSGSSRVNTEFYPAKDTNPNLQARNKCDIDIKRDLESNLRNTDDTDDIRNSGSGVFNTEFCPKNIDTSVQASNELDCNEQECKNMKHVEHEREKCEQLDNNVINCDVSSSSGAAGVDDDALDSKTNGVAKRIDKIDGFQLWKFFRVVSHELGHVFGITHCVFFACAMNESSSVQEAVDQPLFLCPVCLKKIQVVAGFDVTKRYQRIKDFLEMVYKGLLEGCKAGKTDRCDLVGVSCSKEDNLDVKVFERFSRAIEWLDSILQFLENNEPE